MKIGDIWSRKIMPRIREWMRRFRLRFYSRTRYMESEGICLACEGTGVAGTSGDCCGACRGTGASE